MAVQEKLTGRGQDVLILAGTQQVRFTFDSNIQSFKERVAVCVSETCVPTDTDK